jgi:hypothetical protein
MAGEGGGTIFLPNVDRGGGQAGVPEWIHQSPPAKEDMSSLGRVSQTRTLTQVRPEEQRLEALQTIKSLFKTPSKALQDLVEITKRTFKSDTVMLTMVCSHGSRILLSSPTGIWLGDNSKCVCSLVGVACHHNHLPPRPVPPSTLDIGIIINPLRPTPYPRPTGRPSMENSRQRGCPSCCDAQF